MFQSTSLIIISLLSISFATSSHEEQNSLGVGRFVQCERHEGAPQAITLSSRSVVSTLETQLSDGLSVINGLLPPKSSKVIKQYDTGERSYYHMLIHICDELEAWKE